MHFVGFSSPARPKGHRADAPPTPATRGRWPTWARAASLAGLLALPLSGCATAPAGSGDDAKAAQARVQTLVGDARCSTDADCRTSAIGAKACGGPAAYIAWSVRSTDEAALGSALADYNATQRADNLREGRISNCALVTDPGATCVASGPAGGRCELRQRPGRSGNPSSR